MIKLPSGVEINSLIEDLRIFSWEAADVLLYYSKILKDPKHKTDILKNDNNEDPVTIADLKVNNLKSFSLDLIERMFLEEKVKRNKEKWSKY